MKTLLRGLLLLLCLGGVPAEGHDPHSFARPDVARATHLDLDLRVDFATRTIAGAACYRIEGASRIVFDTRDLEIQRVTDGTSPLEYRLGPQEEFLGRPLEVDLPPGVRQVEIHYSTRPDSAALQWLEASQTAGKRHPFLFTQSQAILARTWLPCQDGPGMRFTYEATVTVPAGLMAVMSAENPTAVHPDGKYRFRMPQPVPAYLLALAVGDLRFRALGTRTGIYAEPAVIDRAADEFADMEAMLQAAEELYGPYRWGRYDVLVLPPSFPFGGMENPRLTFATPTILAGDRSLTSLIAHELAHSWSGNLVTNATWNDFWLNEGFTVYLERRIMERLYGRAYADMLARLGYEDLEAILEELGPDSQDSRLQLELRGRDPDEGMTDVAYEKGYLLLVELEKVVGRERWDAYLRDYFDRNAFQTMSTDRFRADLLERLPAAVAAVDLAEWIDGFGLPEGVRPPESERFAAVDRALDAWRAGTLPSQAWSTHEWLHFLRGLPEELTAEAMGRLDRAFGFTRSGNSELLAAWLELAIRRGYEAPYPTLEEFLMTVGRRKFLKPLYKALAETPEGKERARSIYARARANYHSVSAGTVDEILGW